MRITAGSTVAAAALLLIVTAFLPSNPNTPLTTTAQAQSADAGSGSPAAGTAAMHPNDPGSIANAEVEELLETRVAVQFDCVSLKDALEYLSQAAKIDILISHGAVDGGANLDEALTLRLQHRELPVRAVLDLLLSERGLSFTVKDGIVRIVGEDQSSELAVYPVRDLAVKVGGIGSSGASMMGGASVPAAPTADQPKLCTRSLAELITETVESESWTAHGGPGTIMEYNGLLVVNHRPVVHAQIRRLLQMLRTAQAQ